MNLFKQPSEFRFPWFGVSLVGIWLFALGMRFWGIDRFNSLVFDEVYYAKFAHNYLSQTPFFDGHPPLSKYIIAIGMWLGNQMPFGQTVKNGLTGGLYAPWTYRWLNALTGSFLPLVIAGIAYQLLRRRSYALIAAVLSAWDGIFLVESRYALNNVYLIIFGLLGWWFLLLALDCQSQNDAVQEAPALQRSGWLVLAGMGFGLSVAIKWNGLWFLLGAYGMWAISQVLGWQQRFQNRRLRQMSSEDLESFTPVSTSIAGQYSPLQRMVQRRWWQMGLYLGAIPFLTYALTWIPHLKLNAKQGYWLDFWTLQQEILSYHNRVGSGPDVHPYCSNWYSWLVMWRPVAYFYRVTGKGDPVPTEQVLPPTTAEKVIYDVHAIGNPFLWWFSTIAIAIVLLLLVGFVVQLVGQWQPHRDRSLSLQEFAATWGLSAAEQWLVLFLGVNYLANLLPWVRVTRCLFLYHYMGALVFASLALAWLIDRWLRIDQPNLRYISLAIFLSVGIAFLYWLPIYLGLPVSSEQFKQLMWLPSWV
ncbi:MAG: phospholipid carrier-dependent glycosyltransferase [Leptolyngbyaceae cyanobacterium bins.302]|nr:phospholipid carrier-dependent glycosyltransferase [Leptolyngbyaceae cyanobacterium bins.302]